MKSRDASLLAQIEAEVVGDGPLAPTLRKCIVLGGQAGSAELRAWATRELKGYGADDDVPEYRTVGAPLLADAVTGNTIVTRQRIGRFSLPEFAQDDIEEKYTFAQGIGGLEALIDQSADKGYLDLSLPMAAELGRMMDHVSDNPYQQITGLYWTVSTASVRGIVDQVKTTLAELVAELRAGLPDEADVPTAAAADQAVHVAVHGDKARVTVASSSSSGGSTATTTLAPEEEQGWWTRSRRIGAAFAGLASVAGLGLAVSQWQDWL